MLAAIQSITEMFTSPAVFAEKMARSSMKGNIKVRLRTYRKLAQLARSGVPLPRALDLLWNIASKNGKKPKEPYAVCMDAWRSSVNNGLTLGEAIDGWVPAGERMLIDAAGAARLDTALDNAADVVEAAKAMKSAIVGSVSYPLFLFAGVGVILWVFGIQVIPAFESVKERSKWTGLAAQMGYMSDFVRYYALYALLGLFAFGFLIFSSLEKWTGSLRTKLDPNVPPYSFYRLFVGSGFLLSLSALVRAGVPVPEALRRLRPAATPWLLERLDAILFHVNEGQQLGEAMYLAGYAFPDGELIEDLRLYATLGSFDERMEQLARQWIEDGVSVVKAQAQALNMAMMVLVGVTVAWLGSGLMELQGQVTSGLS